MQPEKKVQQFQLCFWLGDKRPVDSWKVPGSQNTSVVIRKVCSFFMTGWINGSVSKPIPVCPGYVFPNYLLCQSNSSYLFYAPLHVRILFFVSLAFSWFILFFNYIFMVKIYIKRIHSGCRCNILNIKNYLYYV